MTNDDENLCYMTWQNIYAMIIYKKKNSLLIKLDLSRKFVLRMIRGQFWRQKTFLTILYKFLLFQTALECYLKNEIV